MSSFTRPATGNVIARHRSYPQICSALIAFPFLFPVAAGPSVNVWQQLASWLCILSLLFFSEAKRFNPYSSTTLWLASSAVLVALFRSSYLGLASWLSAVAVLFAMSMATLVGASLTKNRVRVQDSLAYGLLWAGILSAVLGLLQYCELASVLWPWTTEPGAGQAVGNLRQRNQFASLISMALIAALWLHARCHIGSIWRRQLWRGAVSLLLIAAAASTSRTGLLEILVIVGAAAFVARRERQIHRTNEVSVVRLPSPWALLSWVPLYFAAAWLLPQLTGSGVDSMVQRLSEGAPTGHSRLLLWSNVISLIAERPWTGWGWGELSYAHYIHSTLYPGPRFIEILDNAHNLPLHLAVELGIPTALLICGGFTWLVIAARPWREHEPLRLMAWGMLGVIVLHSLLEYPLWYGPFQLVFGLCLGILWPAKHLQRGREEHRWVSVLLATSSAMLIAIIGYASWDYIRISQLYLPREERLVAYRDDPLLKVQHSLLFMEQVRFAELTLTPATRSNALEIFTAAKHCMHFSPEPRIIEKLIESALFLGHREEAQMQADRFAAAFPLDYEAWRRTSLSD